MNSGVPILLYHSEGKAEFHRALEVLETARYHGMYLVRTTASYAPEIPMTSEALDARCPLWRQVYRPSTGGSPMP